MPLSHSIRHAHMSCVLFVSLLGACVSVPEDDLPQESEDTSTLEPVAEESRADDPDAPLDPVFEQHDCRRFDDDQPVWFSLDPESPKLGEPVTVSFHAESLAHDVYEPSLRIVTPQGIAEIEVTRVQTSTKTVWRGTFSPETPERHTLIFYDSRNSMRHGDCAFLLDEI